MKKELTLQDIHDTVTKVVQSAIVDLKETTIKGIQDSIVDLKKSMDDQFTKVEEQFSDLHEVINEHSTEMDRQFRVVHATMATKDFVTEKIGELRSEFFSSGKRPSRRAKATV